MSVESNEPSASQCPHGSAAAQGAASTLHSCVPTCAPTPAYPTAGLASTLHSCVPTCAPTPAYPTTPQAPGLASTLHSCVPTCAPTPAYPTTPQVPGLTPLQAAVHAAAQAVVQVALQMVSPVGGYPVSGPQQTLPGYPDSSAYGYSPYTA